MGESWWFERQVVVGEFQACWREGSGGGVVMMPDAEECASIYRPETDREHLGLTAASIARN